jgi:hypothetical protein
MAGGILWLILAFGVILIAVQRYYRNKRAATSGAVQLGEMRSGATEAEAVPDAPSYGAAVYKPSHSASATLPNSEGILSSRMSLLLCP